MKRKSLIWGMILAVAAGAGQVGRCAVDEGAAGERFETVQDYLRYAALNNAGLRGAFESWRAALERIPQAKVLPDPRFTYSYFIEEVETRVGPQENKFGISQTFPWFGKIRARTDAAAAKANAAEKIYEAQKLKLFFRVKDAYYEFAYLKSAIDIAGQNLELLEHFEEVTRTKYMTAAGTHPDIIRAQIELAILEDKLTSLQQLRGPMVAKLNGALNRSEASPLPWPAEVEYEAVEVEREGVIVAVRKRNPELAALDFDVSVAKSIVELAKRRAYPDVTLGVDWIQTGSARNPGVSDSGKDAVIAMFSLNLPIWGASNRAAERQARLEVARTSAQRRQKENDLVSDLAKVIFDFEDSRRKATLYNDILVPKAREMLEASEVAYRAAQIDFLSLIDAQRKLLNFDLLAARAMTDNRQRLAEIEMFTGEQAAVTYGMELTDNEQ